MGNDMEEELKKMEISMPELVLPGEEASAPPVPETPKPAAAEQETADMMASLTPQERKMVEDFAEKINLTDSNLVLQYGAGAQKKIADFSDTALEHIKTKDLGEVGQMLTDLVGELKGMDEEEKASSASLRRTPISCPT